jgi:hypothetical protein
MGIPMMPHDMPKLESPFVRELRGDDYIATPVIAEGYEWVFTDPAVLAVEKLHGTNVSVIMSQGNVVGLYNRMNRMGYSTLDTNVCITGIRNWCDRGHGIAPEGQHFGELMGPKVQDNFLKLDRPTWFPFDYLKEKASYNSFHKYPKTFENISKWFRDDIFSLMYSRYNGEKKFPEGIVFHHPDGRMAKLRRDMFDWFTGHRHKEKEGDDGQH